MAESRGELRKWQPDDVLEAVRLEAMQDLAESAQLTAASPNVHIHKSPNGAGMSIMVDATAGLSRQVAWLAIRDYITPLITSEISGLDKMYYDAWIDPNDGVQTYLGFLNGTYPPNAIAYDPNQTTNVGDDIIDVTLGDGTQRKGLPLHGLEIMGFADGSIKGGTDNPQKSYPLYKITPAVQRWRFNQNTRYMEASYVLWPGILDESNDPVGDDTVSEGTQDKLWTRQYLPGPCASEESP